MKETPRSRVIRRAGGGGGQLAATYDRSPGTSCHRWRDRTVKVPRRQESNLRRGFLQDRLGSSAPHRRSPQELRSSIVATVVIDRMFEVIHRSSGAEDTHDAADLITLFTLAGSVFQNDALARVSSSSLPQLIRTVLQLVAHGIGQSTASSAVRSSVLETESAFLSRMLSFWRKKSILYPTRAEPQKSTSSNHPIVLVRRPICSFLLGTQRRQPGDGAEARPEATISTRGHAAKSRLISSQPKRDRRCRSGDSNPTMQSSRDQTPASAARQRRDSPKPASTSVITWHSDEQGALETAELVRAGGGRAPWSPSGCGRCGGRRRTVDALIAELGGCDVFVNNAGTSDNAAFVDLTLEQVATHDDRRPRGSFRPAAARRLAHGRGRSRRPADCDNGVHEHQPRVGSGAYDAAKHGSRGLMKTIALELASHGITANAVAPGEIATPMTDQELSIRRTVDRPGVPLGRPGDPQEIAAVVAFLASPSSFLCDGSVSGSWMAECCRWGRRRAPTCTSDAWRNASQ